jgi:hypothetical protein
VDIFESNGEEEYLSNEEGFFSSKNKMDPEIEGYCMNFEMNEVSNVYFGFPDPPPHQEPLSLQELLQRCEG